MEVYKAKYFCKQRNSNYRPTKHANSFNDVTRSYLRLAPVKVSTNVEARLLGLVIEHLLDDKEEQEECTLSFNFFQVIR